ncbi:MAG: hydroxyacid dehydrogenase [Burkholderiaceae bacterium]|nr:hydroxyacid dehydrogenase [Burkholderiaceae bacterium]
MLLHDLTADAHQWLVERHEVDYQPALADDPPLLRSQIYDANALIVPPRLKIDIQLLNSAPRLMAIGRICDDTDNLDLQACQRRGVRIIQASGFTARASAEYLLFSLLSLYRRGAQARGSFTDAPQGREINDSVVALLGLTPPAQLLASTLTSLGACVVGYDPAVHRSAELWHRLGVQPMGLAAMLKIADAVSVQLVYASRYRGLVGERVLESCKPGQLWASITRSLVFDLPALAAALRDGRIGALLMDSDDEQLAHAGNPLKDLPNLRITPGAAPLTQESMVRGSWHLADRIHHTLVKRRADQI